MTDPFQRLNEDLAEHLGVAVRLRNGTMDATDIVAIIHKDVEVQGAQSDMVYRRDEAGIPSSACPKIGETLTITETGYVGHKDYVLDAKERDDGYEARFILRKS